MSMSKKVLTALCLTGGLVVTTAGVAAADSGDGSLACNGGEICFSRDDGNYTYQKHFWYSADHAGYKFVNVTNGTTTSSYVRDGADQIRNRDSNCDVKVVDDRGWYPDDVFVAINDGSWKTISSAVDNENDRHERFSC